MFVKFRWFQVEVESEREARAFVKELDKLCKKYASHGYTWELED